MARLPRPGCSSAACHPSPRRRRGSAGHRERTSPSGDGGCRHPEASRRAGRGRKQNELRLGRGRVTSAHSPSGESASALPFAQHLRVRTVRPSHVGREDLLVRPVGVAAFLVKKKLASRRRTDRAAAESTSHERLRSSGDPGTSAEDHPPVVLEHHAGVEKQPLARDVVEPGIHAAAPRPPRKACTPRLVRPPQREKKTSSPVGLQRIGRTFAHSSGQDRLLAGTIDDRDDPPLAVPPGMVEERDELALGRYANGAQESLSAS